MGEMLEENTTLKHLVCQCMIHRKKIQETESEGPLENIVCNLEYEGVRELSEGLQGNSTLMRLDLTCQGKKKQFSEKCFFELNIK